MCNGLTKVDTGWTSDWQWVDYQVDPLVAPRSLAGKYLILSYILAIFNAMVKHWFPDGGSCHVKRIKIVSKSLGNFDPIHSMCNCKTFISVAILMPWFVGRETEPFQCTLSLFQWGWANNFNSSKYEKHLKERIIMAKKWHTNLGKNV